MTIKLEGRTITMDRLRFVYEEGKFSIYNNSKNEYLGCIAKWRTGRFIHWCFHPASQTVFSPGCHDEVRAMMKNAEKTKKEIEGRADAE
jgi:hypothetical protein